MIMKRVFLLILLSLIIQTVDSYLGSRLNKDEKNNYAEAQEGAAIKPYGMDNFYPYDRFYNSPGWQYKTSLVEGNYVKTWTQSDNFNPSYLRNSSNDYYIWEPSKLKWIKTR